MDAVKTKFPDAKLTGASKEVEKDKAGFEVAFTTRTISTKSMYPRRRFIAFESTDRGQGITKEVAKTFSGQISKAKYRSSRK